MDPLRVGLDLGGTKLCGAVVDAAGRVAAGPLLEATDRQRPPQAVIAALVDLVCRLEAASPGPVAGVGIGIPTTLDAQGGLVPCPNLPTMGGVSIRAELEGRLGRPVVLENDANCYAWGEWRAGAGRGTRHCCCLTLGTGLGMGIILNGALHRGAHGSAGEVCYSPYAGGRQVEEVASGLGIARAYGERTGRQAGAVEVAQAARQGDEAAQEVWREFGTSLGFAICYAVNLLDPEVVVLGGGMVEAWDLFHPSLGAVVERHAYDSRLVRLVRAELGGLGGAIGAALVQPE
ncbi:MAG: ROK family protein [Candidatus Latescibacterota bacterium]